jgi:phosphoribosylaminoimidazolecarboxamide formyltransferase / IMP cyclohydrolase
VAIGATLLEAYGKALSCDTTSAFGGIIAFNRKLDGATAAEISKLFTEVIIAPDADESALQILAQKKNLRLLLLEEIQSKIVSSMTVKTISGAMLVQSVDSVSLDEKSLRVVSKRQPSTQEMEDLRFAFRVAKHVKSNAIVFVKNGATTGIGAGQMSRIDSTRIAVRKSADASGVAGSVLASDAFFPFADGIEAAAAAGATAIIQPGGSLKDDEVIKAADAAGLAMVFTGIRHFKH